MQLYSLYTKPEWKSVGSPDPENNRDPVKEEIQRVLSDCFRCNNLVILTGLGTSLYVNFDAEISKAAGRRSPKSGKKLAPTMWDLWSKAETATAKTFEEVKALVKFPETEKGNIESLLSYCKLALSFVEDPQKQKIKDFVSTIEGLIHAEVNFLSEDDEVRIHSEMLRRIARRTNRKARTKIFTTNYDLCFEYAARAGRFVVIDGFSHTAPQIFDSLHYSYDIVRRDHNPDSHDFIPNVFHLYKLHGSIDWEKNEKTNEIERRVNTKSPLLIYPRSSKYELAFEQPYIEMMSAFQSALRQPNTGLLIIGFGFNDNHISEPVLSAIASNLGLKVVVCTPDVAPKNAISPPHPGEAQVNPKLRKLRSFIDNGDARLSFINCTFEDLVPELPDISALTELEQHAERMRLIRSTI